MFVFQSPCRNRCMSGERMGVFRRKMYFGEPWGKSSRTPYQNQFFRRLFHKNILRDNSLSTLRFIGISLLRAGKKSQTDSKALEVICRYRIDLHKVFMKLAPQASNMSKFFDLGIEKKIQILSSIFPSNKNDEKIKKYHNKSKIHTSLSDLRWSRNRSKSDIFFCPRFLEHLDVSDESKNTANRKIYFFCIEAVPQLFFQLRK